MAEGERTRGEQTANERLDDTARACALLGFWHGIVVWDGFVQAAGEPGLGERVRIAASRLESAARRVPELRDWRTVTDSMVRNARYTWCGIKVMFDKTPLEQRGLGYFAITLLTTDVIDALSVSDEARRREAVRRMSLGQRNRMASGRLVDVALGLIDGSDLDADRAIDAACTILEIGENTPVPLGSQT